MLTRNLTLRALSPIPLLLAFLGIATAQDSHNKDSATLTPNGTSITLDIESGRPVLRAVLTFEQRYGYVITYEDPGYVFSDDLTDATSDVRRDHRPAGSKVRSIMLPRTTRLSMQIPASSCISKADMEALLSQLVETQSDEGPGGHFRAEQSESGSLFHVIPTEVRDSNGSWQPAVSPLDARISFPAAKRTEQQLLAVIANAVSISAGVRMGATINGGVTIFLGPQQHHDFNIGADDETAREVLTRILTANPHVRQSYTLMRAVEEGPNSYFLVMMDMPANPTCQAVKPPPPPPPPHGSSCAACGPPSSSQK